MSRTSHYASSIAGLWMHSIHMSRSSASCIGETVGQWRLGWFLCYQQLDCRGTCCKTCKSNELQSKCTTKGIYFKCTMLNWDLGSISLGCNATVTTMASRMFPWECQTARCTWLMAVPCQTCWSAKTPWGSMGKWKALDVPHCSSQVPASPRPSISFIG